MLSPTYDFLLATMGISRTVSEIDGDFSRKSQKFPPLVFASLLKGFPLELGIGARVKKPIIVGLLGREKSLTISSVVWIQYTNVTDRRTPGDSKDRAYAFLFVLLVFV